MRAGNFVFVPALDSIIKLPQCISGLRVLSAAAGSRFLAGSRARCAPDRGTELLHETDESVEG
jgi:hypothetical protein